MRCLSGMLMILSEGSMVGSIGFWSPWSLELSVCAALYEYDRNYIVDGILGRHSLQILE